MLTLLNVYADPTTQYPKQLKVQPMNVENAQLAKNGFAVIKTRVNVRPVELILLDASDDINNTHVAAVLLG